MANTEVYLTNLAGGSCILSTQHAATQQLEDKSYLSVPYTLDKNYCKISKTTVIYPQHFRDNHYDAYEFTTRYYAVSKTGTNGLRVRYDPFNSQRTVNKSNILQQWCIKHGFVHKVQSTKTYLSKRKIHICIKCSKLVDQKVVNASDYRKGFLLSDTLTMLSFTCCVCSTCLQTFS